MMKSMSVTLTKFDLVRKNFNWKDFFVSDLAYRLNNDSNPLNNIDNSTSNLNLLTAGMVTADKAQEVRNILGLPVIIHSCFRVLALNRLLKSKDSSQHCKFEAFDFSCPKFGGAEKIVRFLMKSGVVVDQCLIEKSGEKEWVHLSIKFSGNRNQFGSLINGKFTIIS